MLLQIIKQKKEENLIAISRDVVINYLTKPH